MTARMVRLSAALLVSLLAGLLLACGGGAVATRAPRWACPSPEPLPWGEAGPVKEIVRHTRPISEGGDWEEPVYYDEWEQEYGATHPGPPFPSPTPYALVGTSYVFGQRVEVWPFHVLVEAQPGPIIDVPGVASGTQQLYLVAIAWVNHLPEELPVSYAEQVRLRAITDPSGAVISDSRWGVTVFHPEQARSPSRSLHHPGPPRRSTSPSRSQMQRLLARHLHRQARARRRT
jgi:hypothetical protein